MSDRIDNVYTAEAQESKNIRLILITQEISRQPNLQLSRGNLCPLLMILNHNRIFVIFLIAIEDTREEKNNLLLSAIDRSSISVLYILSRRATVSE